MISGQYRSASSLRSRISFSCVLVSILTVVLSFFSTLDSHPFVKLSIHYHSRSAADAFDFVSASICVRLGHRSRAFGLVQISLCAHARLVVLSFIDCSGLVKFGLDFSTTVNSSLWVVPALRLVHVFRQQIHCMRCAAITNESTDERFEDAQGVFHVSRIVSDDSIDNLAPY